ncbi:MAG: DUF1467 family protein [Sphingomonadales bacterium]|nr:MAG: DUF1467 family protein [Sphingomonadales bacterium]TNF01703.1 MAG: DUF1467 family protein [Sphingomonadales bacterium]
MQITSIIAIYALFWVMSAFLMLPVGIRTPDETGEQILSGQAESAPSNFRPGRLILRATLLSILLFGLFYLNYQQGWITVRDIDIAARLHPQG